MNTNQPKTKKDSRGFERFDNLLRRVVKVSKEEILWREKAAKKRKKAEKKVRA